jgi:hypothetical protein
VGSGFAELRGLTPKGANDDSNKSIHGTAIPGEYFLSYCRHHRRLESPRGGRGLTGGNFGGWSGVEVVARTSIFALPPRL